MSLSQKDSLQDGNSLILCIEKVPDAAIIKVGYADSLLGHERTHHHDFLEKGTTLNSASYCQLFMQNSSYL